MTTLTKYILNISTQEAMSLAHIEDRQQWSEQWDTRELAFYQNTKRTVLQVISEKLKVPRVFEVRDTYIALD